MKLPVFHKYFSTNIAMYIAILELLAFIPILLFFALPSTFLFFVGFLLIIFLYITHYCIVPFFIFLIPIEFYLRKKGKLIKSNIVNISVKYQQYIYIAVVLIYVIITIIGIINNQPMTEEELRYD